MTVLPDFSSDSGVHVSFAKDGHVSELHLVAHDNEDTLHVAERIREALHPLALLFDASDVAHHAVACSGFTL